MGTVPTGVRGLDALTDGGFPRGSTVIVEGAPGTGKTTLGMQFLHHGAVSDGEAGIYITFEEFPDQLYRDMLAFGWDLRKLEAGNLLRVVAMSPDVFLEQMTEPGGLLEKMIRELDCKRMVIDSISLFRYGAADQEEHRRTLYRLRNILRKFELTSLLIKERGTSTDVSGFEAYISDGFIALQLKQQMEKYRVRTLEILKMRGKRIQEGEHVYRITDAGIHLIPSRSMVEDRSLLKGQTKVPTGIAELDRLLGGGLAKGTVTLLDTNSKANYKYMISTVLANRYEAGDHILALLSSFNTPQDLKRMFAMQGLSLGQIAREDRIYFIEHYNRRYPEGCEANVIDVSGADSREYRHILRERFGPVVEQGLERGDSWFIYYDLNTVISERGKDHVMKFFAEETASIKSLGMTMMVMCNFSEIGPECSAYLERTCNGVIRTWVDGNYQYLQVTKSPNGVISEPYIVETTDESPFIRLM
ncbi:ATPase domain-containing protein [Paenibacillus flagellatus]|uniref:Circadian clock protein KaiC n=1 Tax=Paenibacillus flagellatus TaxID=2211139 RepID=A0A2V5JZR7_9BACL|nr:ATPase domain-containing protein [Paenibacillus flagellatus]PYI50723.1 circadian clock protein KaiC [Paenibacillus flagellatus]